jgi:hypothetical protein
MKQKQPQRAGNSKLFIGDSSVEVHPLNANRMWDWILATGHWLLTTDHWLLVTGYWLLVTGYWLLATDH